MKKVLIAVTILSMASLAAACHHESKSSQKACKAVPKAPLTDQTTCPVMGGKISKELFVEQDGKRIYLCCAGCTDKVKKNFSKYVAELEKKGQKVELLGSAEKQEKTAVKLSEQKTCPVMGGKINKKLYTDYKGQRIYVCCAGCIDTVNKNPEKYISILAEKGEGVEKLES